MIPSHSRDNQSYELNERPSIPSHDEFVYSSSFEDDGARAGLLAEDYISAPVQRPFISSLISLLPFWHRANTQKKRLSRKRRQWILFRPSVLRKLIVWALIGLVALIGLISIFFPSYTHPPLRYTDLRSRTLTSFDPGRGNPGGQKVFIAASIFDKSGELARGAWGESILGLIDLLGPQNVYLSVYENDAGEVAEAALQDLAEKVNCDKTLQFDRHLSLDEVPHIQLPDGSDRVKRIAYLSEVRNRALKPLEESQIRYDKMLYINDVIFDPVEAAQLLFSTNANEGGKTNYRAACAVDFINPFKYYDTFATRDFEGYGIGLPFFPWFTSAGAGVSKRDVLAGSDAVRVRSCWGGMVAFDAQFFQPNLVPDDALSTAGNQSPSNLSVPYRFRAEEDLYWDASECCLIHADIQDHDSTHSGIYMNPYVRVAYDKGTLSWLGVSRRLERLYTPVHYLISRFVGMPWYNPRQREHAWEEVEESVWVPNSNSPSGGSFQTVNRVATHSGFCGRRALQVMKKDITSEGKNWEFLPVPKSV